MKHFKEHAKNNKKAYTLLSLVLLFVLVGIVVKEANARLGSFGKIEVEGVIGGAAIVIDDRIVESADSGISTIITSARPGTREITVQKEGYWSWQKELEIEEDETVQIAPFLLRRQPLLANIGDTEAEERDRAVTLFLENTDRTGTQTLTSLDGNVTVWQEPDRVVARYNGDISDLPHSFCNDTGCTEEMAVVELGDTPVQSIDFLSDRNDVLLLTFDQGIFALELDKRSNQNLQPLVELPGADFRNRDDQSLFLEIDGQVGILVL